MAKKKKKVWKYKYRPGTVMEHGANPKWLAIPFAFLNAFSHDQTVLLAAYLARRDWMAIHARHGYDEVYKIHPMDCEMEIDGRVWFHCPGPAINKTLHMKDKEQEKLLKQLVSENIVEISFHGNERWMFIDDEAITRFVNDTY